MTENQDFDESLPYVKLFNHAPLDDPFNSILRYRFLDEIPNVIYVNKNREIKIDLWEINQFESQDDLDQFFAEHEGQLPRWTFQYRHNLTGFQRKLYVIANFLYDVTGMGWLRYVSDAYFRYTGRQIEDHHYTDKR